MESGIEKDLKLAIRSHNPKSLLIHSGLMNGFKVEFNKNDREKFVSDHYRKISEVVEGRQIIMPAFNYKFLANKETSLQSRSEVGTLSEFFRNKISSWRTLDPVFSFAGIGRVNYTDPVRRELIIDPFGPLSFFNYLYDEDALLLHYGSEFKHSTIIHFIERKLGSVPYRYDKIFRGQIEDDGDLYNLQYCYHVRPMGKHLDYNWSRLIADLTDANVLFSLNEDQSRICYCRIRPMVDYLFSRIEEDPYYLLDESSKAWVLPMIDKLGRNFVIQDFEPHHGDE